MTRKLQILFAVAVLAVPLGAAVAGPSREGPELSGPLTASVAEPLVPWKAVAASGLVETAADVGADEQWARVQRGDQLAPRTVLRTGRRGRTTLVQQASVMLVAPKSLLELPVDGTAEQPDTVTQSSGSVVYRIDGASHRGFRVVTPHLVAGVKGTVFMVTVTDRHAAVTVDEGIVEVLSRDTGEQRDVQAGETLLVDIESTTHMELVSRRTGQSAPNERHGKQTRRMARAEERRLVRVVEENTLDMAVQLERAGEPLQGGAIDVVGVLMGSDDADPTRLGFAGGENDIVVKADDVGGSIDELSQDQNLLDDLDRTTGTVVDRTGGSDPGATDPDNTDPGGGSGTTKLDPTEETRPNTPSVHVE